MKIENIKFKAKRLDNGEWVEGNLRTTKSGNAMIIPIENSGAYPVELATVCQFTGIKDCEGKEIWEGDIIKSPYFVKLAIVKWDDSLCGFKCVGVTGNIYYSLSSLVVFSRWYVVGNKFDKEGGKV